MWKDQQKSPEEIWQMYKEYAKAFIEARLDILDITNPIAFIEVLLTEIEASIRYSKSLAIRFTEDALQAGELGCITFGLLFIACIEEIFGENTGVKLFLELPSPQVKPKDTHVIVGFPNDLLEGLDRSEYYEAIYQIVLGQTPKNISFVDFSGSGIKKNKNHTYFVHMVEMLGVLEAIERKINAYQVYFSEKEITKVSS